MTPPRDGVSRDGGPDLSGGATVMPRVLSCAAGATPVRSGRRGAMYSNRAA